MKYTVTRESFENIEAWWLNARYPLRWRCVFVLPTWLKAWWHTFGDGSELFLCAVRKGEALIGIAPLLLRGERACLIGNTDVCDYLDFIVAPGKGHEFFEVLLDHLRKQGIPYLDLKLLRPDSTVFTELTGLAPKLGWEVFHSQEDVALELDLPSTWDDYLLMLSGKQRHEIKRKMRRLQEAAAISYRAVNGNKELKEAMHIFLTLFGRSSEDKAAFMTPRMASFFDSVAEAMAAVRIVKLFILELDKIPAAVAMCFDYNSTIYLYNSCYNDRFNSLSVGLLCKVLSIQDSIKRGREKYDFLKGAESYKHRLGGKEVPLYRCQIRLQ